MLGKCKGKYNDNLSFYMEYQEGYTNYINEPN